MPYRRRRVQSKTEKLILGLAAAGFGVIAILVVVFVIWGGEIFGTNAPPVFAAPPNTLGPTGQRPPNPALRPPPGQQSPSGQRPQGATPVLPPLPGR
jgi:hypothetical protein